MNNQAITTYDELLREKSRLQEQLAMQRKQIQADILAMKEDFKPISSLLATAGEIITRGSSSGLVGQGVKLGVDYLVKKLLRRKGDKTKTV